MKGYLLSTLKYFHNLNKKISRNLSVWLLISGFFLLAGVHYKIAPVWTIGFGTLIFPALVLLLCRYPRSVLVAWFIYAIYNLFSYNMGAHTVGNGVDYVSMGFLIIYIAAKLRYSEGTIVVFLPSFLKRCGTIAFLISLLNLRLFFAGWTFNLDFIYTSTALFVLFGMSFQNIGSLTRSGVYRFLLLFAFIGIGLTLVSVSFGGIYSHGMRAELDGFLFRLYWNFSKPIPYLLTASAAIFIGYLIRAHLDRNKDTEPTTATLAYWAVFFLILATYKLFFRIDLSLMTSRLDIYLYFAPVLFLSLYLGFRYGGRGTAFVISAALILYIQTNINLGRAPEGCDGGSCIRENYFYFINTVLENGIGLFAGVRIYAPSFFVTLGTAVGLAYVGQLLKVRLAGACTAMSASSTTIFETENQQL